MARELVTIWVFFWGPRISPGNRYLSEGMHDEMCDTKDFYTTIYQAFNSYSYCVGTLRAIHLTGVSSTTCEFDLPLNLNHILRSTSWLPVALIKKWGT